MYVVSPHIRRTFVVIFPEPSIPCFPWFCYFTFHHIDADELVVPDVLISKEILGNIQSSFFGDLLNLNFLQWSIRFNQGESESPQYGL